MFCHDNDNNPGKWPAADSRHSVAAGGNVRASVTTRDATQYDSPLKSQRSRPIDVQSGKHR